MSIPDDVAFTTELSLLLGIDDSGSGAFFAPDGIVTPGGFCARLIRREGDPFAVRADLFLPVAAAELAGDEVVRLLAIQAVLLEVHGWYLGLSEEGMLRLAMTGWTGSASEICRCLDAGSVIGAHVLRGLFDLTGVAP
jgi:hypothetical protein